jgi:hypothetical protein
MFVFMNPLLEQLEALQGYRIDGNHYITSLAFADDLILLADNQEMAQKLLCHTALNLQKIGNTIAADNSAVFREDSIRDTWYISDTQLYLEGMEMIPFSTAECVTIPRKTLLHRPVWNAKIWLPSAAGLTSSAACAP